MRKQRGGCAPNIAYTLALLGEHPTMMATVEGSGVANNAYAVVDVHSDGTLVVDGFRKQQNYSLIPAIMHRH
jgi:hypothetical protein